MNTQLKSFIDSRDDALVAYSLTGETIDKARYNKSVRLLRDYVNSNGINMNEDEIDILMYESMGLKKEKSKEKLDMDGMDENFEGDYL